MEFLGREQEFVNDVLANHVNQTILDRLQKLGRAQRFADLYEKRIRPNRVLAPQDVYETKTARWLREWPSLLVYRWNEDPRHP